MRVKQTYTNLTVTTHRDPTQGWVWRIMDGEKPIESKGGFLRQSTAQVSAEKRLAKLQGGTA